MKNLKKITVLIGIITLAYSCTKNDDYQEPDEFEFNFDFSKGKDEWLHGFADYNSEIDESIYALGFKFSALPEPLDVNQKSLFITGVNRSDDLFMYIKRKVSLAPNTTYNISFDIEFASIYPTNAVGVGGAPGESVYMKAGAVLVEPNKVESDGIWRMNLDIGNQGLSGADMKVIGHVGVADDTVAYTLVSNNNLAEPFIITTDTKGEAWVIIGTDSGFESTTALYYNKISIKIEKQN